MTHRPLSTPHSGLRVFSAALLSALLIVMPFVQLAAAEKRSEVRGQRPESARQGAEGTQQDTAKNAAPESVFLNAPVPKPAPEPLAAIIGATKDDGLAAATTVAPGGTITYTVTINNTGADPATTVQFNDTIDPHTTLVAGSPVAAASDSYNTIGNVQISIPAPGLLTNDFRIETGNNTGMATTAETKSSTSCTVGCSNNVVISTDGSFTYNPPVGFSGTDTFTYTTTYTGVFGTASATTTVKISVANEIWFINNNAGACPGAPCDGRLSHPFPSLAAFNAANLGGAGQPGDDDWIFVYESALDYTGPATLRNGQKFIGQDATASLSTLTGFPAPSGTDPLPAMNSGNLVFVNISATNVNGINLLSGNTLRGFRVGNVGTGTKIAGTNFGTLVVGNSALPDVLLNGTGRALSLTTGTLAVTGGFISVESTLSSTQGINLSGVADSDGAGAGAFSFGSTTVTTTGQGILISTTPADLNFGDTSVTGGTNAVSFQSNAGGTRTFGSLTTSGATAQSFLHGAGGGNVTVTGAASLSSGGSAISVSAPGATNVINFQAATSATSTGAGNTAVNWAGVAGATLTFNSLSITRNNGTALNATGGGTVNVTNGAGSITNTTPAGPAIIAANIALNANFSSINSTGGANAVSLTSVTGTSNFGTGQLTGTASGITFLISAGTATVTYSGHITQGFPVAMVSIIDHGVGTLTFQTGTLSATLGPGIAFDNADGIYNFSGTTTLAGGNAHIDIIDGTGGAITFGANTTITNPSGVALNVDGGSPGFAAVTGGISLAGSISKTSGGRLIDFSNYDTGTATISATLSCTISCDGIEVTNNAANSGTVNFSAATKTLSTDTDTAVNLDNNDNGNVNFTGGGLDIDTTSGAGFNAINGGTVTVTTGANPNTVDTTTGTGVAITDTNIGATGVTFRSVNTVGAPNGINLANTGNVVGNFFTITGNGGDCTTGVGTCTGGRIQNSAGANGATSGIGIRLNNTRNISLAHMRINGSQNHGIKGDSVTGITFSDLILDGTNGNDAGGREGAAAFDNLFGTNTITTSHFTGSYTNGLRVSNTTAGTLNGLTITASSFTTTNASGVGEDGIQIEGFTGSNMTITVGGPNVADGNTFNLNEGDHFNVTPANNAIMNITFRNNTLTGDGTLVSPTTLGGGVTINSGLDFEGTLTFNVSNNTISGTTAGSAININKGGSGLFSGTINSNTIGQAGVPFSGCGQNCSGVNLISQHLDGELVVAVTNNTMRNLTASGIRALIRDTLLDGPGSGTANTSLQLTATGNNISEPNENLPISSTGRAINVEVVTSTDEANVCADIGGAGALANTIGGTWNGGGGTNIRVLTRANPTGQFRLPGYAGTIHDQTAVANYLSARNNGTTATGDVNPDNTGTGFTGGAACTSPLALNLFENGNGREYFAQNTILTTPAASDRSAVVGAGQLLAFVLSAEMVTLAQTQPAASSLNRVETRQLSHHANTAKSETRDRKSEVNAHHAVAESRERRAEVLSQPTERSHVARSNSALAAPLSGETVTANIGTLPAGGSVTITFQVTVDNPPNLTLLTPNPRVENQGTVTASGGISVLTDDPETGTAGDKTATRINLFDSQTTLGSSINPSNQGESVTFTATVAIHPAQVPTPPSPVTPTGTVSFFDTLGDANPGNDVTLCSNVLLDGSAQAQCATLSLASGVRSIEARYSGDGNYDPSTGTFSQTVIACTTNPIVTTTADSGAGSLRDALANVCSSPNNNITFNLGSGPNTITALSTLVIARNANITNTITGTNGALTVTAGGGNFGVFRVESPVTSASLSNFTVTGANATGINGGGLLIQSGTVTLTGMLFTGNTVINGDGGGVSATSGTTVNVYNSTFSGNTAREGGGLHSGGATYTLLNVTVTNNNADGNTGTGACPAAGSVNGLGGGMKTNFNITHVTNTIIAGNTACGLAQNVHGSFTTASNNVLSGDPRLGALADNGGLTFTHALLNDSPALDAGDNTAADAIPLTTDQRGTGFARKLDSADANTTQTVDIGAFELHPTVENIPNQNTNEDTPINFNFNIGDDTGTLITGVGGSVTATSSNATLVPNANLSVTDPAPTGGGFRNLSITPAAEQSGTTTITVTVTATNGGTAVDTFDLTVAAQNDAPVITSDGGGPTASINAAENQTAVTTVTSSDVDGGTPAYSIVGGADQAAFTINPTTGVLTFNSAPDFEAPADADTNNVYLVNVQVSDGNGGTDQQDLSVTVTNANEPPVITSDGGGPTASISVAENQTAVTTVTSSDVDADTPSYSIVAGADQTAFSINPTSGVLTFNSAPNFEAPADANTDNIYEVTVQVSDGNGGTDTQAISVTVTNAGDAPVITSDGGGPTASVNAAENQTAVTTVTSTDEDGGTPSYSISGGADSAAFTINPTTGVLTFNSAPNFESPTDANTDNVYEVTVEVSDGNGGTDTQAISVTVTNVNEAPVNTVPGGQNTPSNTSLTFSSGNGNQISVADVDAGANAIKVTLSVTSGTLTLSGTAGLDFSGTCSGAAGDGTADATMTFCGTLTNINNALNGMTFTPPMGFSGAATLTITSADQGNTGSGGAQTDTDVVNIQVATNVSINDAKVAEPVSPNTIDMVFTVALNTPAGGAVTVNFTTNNGTATSGTCGTPGADYVLTNGQVAFATGEQVKTINVPVCSDSDNAEGDETFTVTLSAPTGATIVDGTATGTITVANPAGTVLISEIRTSGPMGAGDDFVELYNNSDAPKDISGYGLFKKGADCNAQPVLIATVPGALGSNTTVIPARGHYLFGGSAYGLTNYGGAGAADDDQTLTSDIENDANVGLFATADVSQISTVNRLDAVGFGTNVGGACNLLREGTLLPAMSGSTLQHSYFRKMCDWVQGSGCTVPGVPKDTNQNADDFWLADTTAAAITGRLGAPGPENIASPRRRDNSGINVFLLDGNVAASANPNRVRDTTPEPSPKTFGTLSLRYRVTNNTGAPVTRLRYRVVDISTAIQPAGPVADLRAIDTNPITQTATPVTDSVTCTAAGAGAPPCSVTVHGTTLEQPPTQVIGGGYNSTLSSGTITTGSPLGTGSSLMINLTLGVNKPGQFRFYIIVEALP